MAYRGIIRRKNKSESRRERERLIDSTLFLNGEDISTKADSHICERESWNWNSKTLFYKDCSLGSVKNLSNN